MDAFSSATYSENPKVTIFYTETISGIADIFDDPEA